jgi:hypothetical protein
MTLDELLLPKLAEWKPKDGAATLEVTDPQSGWTIALTATCVEQIGSRLTQLTLSRVTPVSGNLAERAGAICQRVTGLLESLRVIEIDAEHGRALIRSQEPSRQNQLRSYYEMTLRADGGCTMQRYQAFAGVGQHRQAVPFDLTHDVLGKLVRDLTI